MMRDPATENAQQPWEKNSMNGCQMSLFDGFLTELCDTKPEIGTQLVIHYQGSDYPCTVLSHCGADFFYVAFTGKKIHESDPQVAETGGWHLSLRGYGKSWDFL